MTRAILEAMKEEADAAPEVEVSRSRYGYEIDGQRLRRVTTLCGGIPKPWLGMWAAKTTAEFAVGHRASWQGLPATDAIKLIKNAPWSTRDLAATRGTSIHEAIEATVRNRPLQKDLSEENALCAAHVKRFLKARSSKVLASELTVFSPKHAFAGTLDLWDLDKQGQTWLLDWKSGASVYPEFAVQLAAYLHAEFAVVRKRRIGLETDKWIGKKIRWGPHRAERLGIVHVRSDGVTLHPIRYSDRLWTTFRAAAHVKMFQLDVDSFAGKTPRETIYDTPIDGGKDEQQD